MQVADSALEHLVRLFPVRAGSFIVTLYGDVVAPRGGQLWIGNIIDTCALIDVSESRVRTAVSRLVASNQIVSEREGRKSYYRLTSEAAQTYSEAARLIYRNPVPPPLRGWRLVVLPQGPGRDELHLQLSRQRFGFPRPHLAMVPDRGQFVPEIGAPQFLAATEDDLSALAANAWPLAEINERARKFVQGFEPLRKLNCRPDEALTLRLMLVHIFRAIVLRDPDLPKELLPSDWYGGQARSLFAELYLRLSPPAELAIQEHFVDANGPLTADLSRLARRITDLSGV